MKRSLGLLAVIAALGVSVTACGPSNPASATAPTTPATAPTVTPVTQAPSTPTPVETAKKSSRGNLIKALGQGAGTFDQATKAQLVNFTVNSIAPVTCTEPYATAPTNGHLIAVDVSIATTPELASAQIPRFSLSPADFKFIDTATGTTFNGSLGTSAVFSCLPSAATIPAGGVGPGEKVTGKVILDLPAASGVLVVTQYGGPMGWEYNF